MEMICRTKVKDTLGGDVWTSEVDDRAVNLFGKPVMTHGDRTILAVRSRPRVVDGHLEFSLQDAILMNLGKSSTALIVSLGADGPMIMSPDQFRAPVTDGLDGAKEDYRVGDTAFLSACADEGLPDDLKDVAKDFLKGVREFASDDLVEGKARKWVTKPGNFLAITIQNRNKNFAIHVRKSAVLASLNSLDIRDDRPGYARFWLKSRAQLSDALAAAKASLKTSK